MEGGLTTIDQIDTTKTILAHYADGPTLLDSAVAGLSETDLGLTLSADSWSIRQIVHHIVDGDDIWKTCILDFVSGGAR